MNDAVKIVAAMTGILLLFVVAPALLMLWLHDKYWEGKRKARQHRLLSPMPAEVERLCGGLLPERLISMYEDKDFISQNGLTIFAPDTNPDKAPIFCIEQFIPLTLRDQREVRGSIEPGMECYFAEDAGIFQ